METPTRSRALVLPLILALVVALGLAATPVTSAVAEGRPTSKGRAGDARYVPGSILVGYRATAGRSMRSVASKVGARVRGRIPGLSVHVLSVPEGEVGRALSRLRSSSAVRFAERNAEAAETDTVPNDPLWPNQWAPVKTRAPAAWDLTKGSSQIVVAVLDTGADFTHPDLQGKLVAGYDFVNKDADPRDDRGHGTSVAGVVGAVSNNSAGVASYCWGCRIMPVKVLDSTGYGSYSNIASGITWATDHGAKVINMSLSGTSSSSALASAVKYARERGVVVVASAGNNGNTTPVYPAAIPEVISVAATDQNDLLYSWSNRGSWVDVAAPGLNETTRLGGTYAGFGGTSSAAPVVAGIAGLAGSLISSAGPPHIEQAVQASSTPITGVAHGRVDARATLVALGGSAPLPSPSPSPSPSPTPVPPITKTTVFTGSLNAKNPSRTFDLAVGSGTATAALTFKKASSLTLVVRNHSGSVVASKSGPSGFTLAAPVSPGSYRLEVSGKQATFTLSVVHPVA